MKKQSYPDLIINAFQSVQAWKMLSTIALALLFASVCANIWQANTRTVVLMPQHLATTAKGPIALNLGEPFSPDYLSSIAKGDAYPLLNWTPENIDTQYGTFIARLSPALHDAQKEVLIQEAKKHFEDGLTQSFYVTRTFVKGSEVTLHGILVRTSGGKEVFRGKTAFAFDYMNAGGGLLQVNGVRQPDESEQRLRAGTSNKDSKN
jgi:TraE protein